MSCLPHEFSLLVDIIVDNYIFCLFSDPSQVIGLFPNLLPQEFRNQLCYPEKLPDLEGGELEKGMLVLIEYLTQVDSLITFIQHSLSGIIK